jgi:hypothetical protein
VRGYDAFGYNKLLARHKTLCSAKRKAPVARSLVSEWRNFSRDKASNDVGIHVAFVQGLSTSSSWRRNPKVCPILCLSDPSCEALIISGITVNNHRLRYHWKLLSAHFLALQCGASHKNINDALFALHPRSPYPWAVSAYRASS